MKKIILLSSTILLAACSPSHDHTTTTTPHSEVGTHTGIMISNAMVRPPLPGRDIATAYFTIMNNGPADQIISVSTPISEHTELHTHIHENGVMKMRRITAVDIPANSTLEFKSGSYHVMIFDANIVEGASDVSLTLEFVEADPITLIADIEGGDKSNAMEHEGH